ncbi:helix-turn-helix domain-containing protein [Tenggerimyces flavus]|uniref:Helix-turn-helix domain-containing protein n=1 Tax=Tenggerimyces flavus TaxID=1708749 RepID=A0ABV7YJU7_9ACTN|nr:helix-turn-helix domain-containing protein [Tenggerimyces flavus]MBM7785871.1 transcriptional regulator GlxA family with amidase domain [Tenggerimyces flavus]
MHRIAIPVVEDMPMYELGIAWEIFGARWYDDWYELTLCADHATRLEPGVVVTPDAPLSALGEADTVLVPALPFAWLGTGGIPPELVAAVRQAAANGARMISLCSGAFVLAAAGVLDDRRATTHWQQTHKLAARYPRVDVDQKALYVDEENVLTSAGRSAGMDLCLHVVRKDKGAQTANRIARAMVVQAHRTGGQNQYVDEPIPATDDESLAPLLQWAEERLDQPLTVAALARQAQLSERTFMRRFHASTGTTVRQWLLAQRLNRARDLLETTAMSVDQVSQSCGLGSATNLRHHFGTHVGATPTSYRRAFRNGT